MVQEQVYVFIRTVISIYRERASQLGTLTFDKDDDLAIDFVSAATNLRAFNFSINMAVSDTDIDACRASS